MNHRLMCVLLDTGATPSVLSERAWEKCKNFSGLEPVTGRLTAANGIGLTVLGEAEFRFRIGNIHATGLS